MCATVTTEVMKGIEETHQGVRTEVRWRPPLKAALLNRSIAKFVDLLIVAALAELPSMVGFYAGLTYLLIADGLSQGRSVGKRLIGLEVVLPASATPCTFRESILRNTPLAVATILYAKLPYLGWLLGLSVFVLEALLAIGNERGQRVGDELAGTQVIERRVEEADGWDP